MSGGTSADTFLNIYILAELPPIRFLTFYSWRNFRRAFFKFLPPGGQPAAPRPFGFLVSGARAQGLLLLHHLAAVAHGDSVLLLVGTYHAAVFELDVDGFAEVSKLELTSTTFENVT